MAKLTKEEKRKKKYEETHKLINKIDHKVCGGECKEWFPSTNEYFYKNKSNSIDGLHPYCKVCSVDKATVWKKANPERYYKAMKKQSDKPKNKELKRIREQKRREEGKYREWQDDNREKVNSYGKDRRQNKMHEISNEEWLICKKYFNNSCAYCGLHIDDHSTDLHKEHVNPDGSNKIDNCVPACRSCNSSKRVDSLNKWYSVNNTRYSDEKYSKILNWLKSDYQKLQ